MPTSPPSVLWLRRDLRLGDHPALLAAQEAAGQGGAVVPLFVLDPALWERGGPVRRAWLAASLRALDEDLGGLLVLVHRRFLHDPLDAVLLGFTGADGNE